MEQHFKSSFIPRKDIAISTHGSSVSQHVERGLIDKIAVLIFVLTLFAWGGLFGYQKYVEASITKTEKQIVEARSRIDNSKVDEFRALGKQIEVSKQLFNDHVFVSPIFDVVDQFTLPSVQLLNFTFELLPAGLRIETEGRASNFAAVELQEQMFKKAEGIKDAHIFDMGLDTETGEVTFNATFVMPRNEILYTELMKQVTAPVVQPIQTETASTSMETELPDVNDAEFEGLFNELDSL